MLYTKFGESGIKGIGAVAKNLKLTFDLGVTLTFDLHKIQYHEVNLHTVKHIPIKFGVKMPKKLF